MRVAYYSFPGFLEATPWLVTASSDWILESKRHWWEKKIHL